MAKFEVTDITVDGVKSLGLVFFSTSTKYGDGTGNVNVLESAEKNVRQDYPEADGIMRFHIASATRTTGAFFQGMAFKRKGPREP